MTRIDECRVEQDAGAQHLQCGHANTWFQGVVARASGIAEASTGGGGKFGSNSNQYRTDSSDRL